MSFLAVRCPRCTHIQAPGPYCRRCEKQLPAPGQFADNVQYRPLFPEQLPTLAELEKQLIEESLRRAKGQKPEAAKMIGLGKTTFYRKLKEYAAEAAR